MSSELLEIHKSELENWEANEKKKKELEKLKLKLEKIKKMKEKLEKMKKEVEKMKMKNIVRTQSAEATDSDTSNSAVSGSNHESVGKKRRRSKRSVPDEFVFCDLCGREWYKQCKIHGKMMIIPNIPVDKEVEDNVAKKTTPRILEVGQSEIVNAGYGVRTSDMIKKGILFGPSYQRNKKDTRGRTDKGGPKDPNCASQEGEMAGGYWMRYVNRARHINEINLMPHHYEGRLYYRTSRVVGPHEELFRARFISPR